MRGRGGVQGAHIHSIATFRESVTSMIYDVIFIIIPATLELDVDSCNDT